MLSPAHCASMARLMPHSPLPPHIPDPSNLACSECVVDCDDADCMAEVDDRCTEQCVIVPCDSPEHGDIQCPKGDCESTCGVSDTCSLVCTILWNTLTISDICTSVGAPSRSVRDTSAQGDHLRAKQLLYIRL